MTARLYARLASVNPKTQRISLSREFIEVSEPDLRTMTLPDHVVRVDLFTAQGEEKPKRRIILGVEKIYTHDAIEDEFGPMFADKITESGATHAAFIDHLGKLVPALPGDEIWMKDGQSTAIE